MIDVIKLYDAHDAHVNFWLNVLSCTNIVRTYVYAWLLPNCLKEISGGVTLTDIVMHAYESL